MSDVATVMENVEKQIKTELEFQASRAARRIADELTETAESAINDFYSWRPKMYHRNGSAQKMFQRYYRNPHNSVYHGGVEFLPNIGSYHANYLPGNPSVMSRYIFNLVYLQGRHGATEDFPESVRAYISNYPPMMITSPMKQVLKKRKEILSNFKSYFNY